MDLPKKEIFSATLSASSIVAIASALGLLAGLFSTAAAMAVRAAVALIPMVSLLISGTLPMSKLNTTVDFSASLTRSRNLCTLGVGAGDKSFLSLPAPVLSPAELSRLSDALTRSCRLGLLPAKSEFLALGRAPRETIWLAGSESLSISESETAAAAAAASGITGLASALRNASAIILLFSLWI